MNIELRKNIACALLHCDRDYTIKYVDIIHNTEKLATINYVDIRHETEKFATINYVNITQDVYLS